MEEPQMLVAAEYMDRRCGPGPAHILATQPFPDGESQIRHIERPVVVPKHAPRQSRVLLCAQQLRLRQRLQPCGLPQHARQLRYGRLLRLHATTAASRAAESAATAAASASAWAINACSRTCSAARCLSWARYSRRDAEKSRYFAPCRFAHE